jgi:activating signal cointegrator complex subunit 2
MRAPVPPLLAQVREMLPEYGDGFLAACLAQLGGSPERVLNALLEGSLPKQLAKLDTQLSLADWQAAADAATAASGYDADFPATLGGGQAADAAGTAPVSAAPAGGGQPRTEGSTARYLDAREASYREALFTAANAVQVRELCTSCCLLGAHCFTSQVTPQLDVASSVLNPPLSRLPCPSATTT